jgi:dethiobiotin synthetase
VIPGVFVTGTDTGVGKTLIACALIHALTARGVKVLPMKPIAAGAVIHDGGWANQDSIALLRAADGHPARMRDVTPVLLRQPMAPHIAAARENRRIMLEPILASYRKLAADAQFMVVEGVGGFRVPLDVDLDTVHLARAIGLPVLLVVGMRLGCLNHALLTADAIKAAGLPFAGWVANTVDADMAVPMENIAALEDRLDAPLLARIPFASPPDARLLAAAIDAAALLGKGRA